jgi:outer membrane protein
MMQKKIFLTLVLMLTLCQGYAKDKRLSTQPLPVKIGYASMEYIFQFLPEVKAITSEYASFEKQLKNKIAANLAGIQQKLQAFEQGSEAMTEEVRNQKQVELQQLKESFGRLQIESQEKLQNKQINLFEPVYEKINSAISKVVEEDGYTHILNSSVVGMPVLLYVSEEYHISDRVLKKLGIDLDKAKDTKQ